MNTLINNLEAELIKLFRDNGVIEINTGDIYKSAPRYPAVDIMLTYMEQNDMQVMQKGKIGWNLYYDISCMYAGSEAGQTFKNSRSFVNNIYDLIQDEKGTRLSNTVYDLECVRIEYGRTAVADRMADGGVIKVIIQILEIR